jgi:hypothetical protein
MILGYHLILGARGNWLPNDPRGSGSDFVRARKIRRFGPATKVHTTRSVAGRPHDRALRQAAKDALKYPPVVFSGRQALAVANGFGKFVRKSGLIVWACSILR